VGGERRAYGAGVPVGKNGVGQGRSVASGVGAPASWRTSARESNTQGVGVGVSDEDEALSSQEARKAVTQSESTARPLMRAG
jgi:hypothetical protein